MECGLHNQDVRQHPAPSRAFMSPHSVRTALRSLRTQPVYTALNVVGLATGMAACLLIGLYVWHELSYDAFHAEADRVVRVLDRTTTESGLRVADATAAPLGPAAVATVPSVEKAARIGQFGTLAVRRGDEPMQVRQYLTATPAFAQMFDWPSVHGDLETTLATPNQMAVTPGMARELFGRVDVVGETVEADQIGTLEVGAVVRVPENSSLRFRVLLSESTLFSLLPEDMTAWDVTGWGTFLQLAPRASVDGVERQIDRLLDENLTATAAAERSVALQPLTDVYLHSGDVEATFATNSARPSTLFALIAIGGLILVIAGINYTSLATAQSLRRGREVGVRKTLGASQHQITQQFLGEAVVVGLVSLVAALPMAVLAQPAVSWLTGESLAFGLLDRPLLLAASGTVAVFIGAAAGALPAFYLARLDPRQILSGFSRSARQSTRVRRGAVVIQFALAMILGVSVVIVYAQLDYIQDKPLGFDTEPVIAIDVNSQAMRARSEIVRDQLARIPGVQATTLTTRVPGRQAYNWSQATVTPAQRSRQAPVQAQWVAADQGFLDTYGVDLIEGRTFDPARAADSTAVLLNRSAARALGWEQPVGRQLRIASVRDRSDVSVNETARVIGVVDDLHLQSLREEVAPLVIPQVNTSWPVTDADHISLRIENADVSSILAAASGILDAVDPTHGMDVAFLDQQVAAQYRTERRTGRMVGVASGLAVFVACLGLLGLAAYAARQRTKEIGIRKALGATRREIVMLLTSDFARLVGIAIVLSAPLAYGIGWQWLQQFAYRIDLGPGLVLAGSAAVFVLAMTVVGMQALRVSSLQPATTLRDE